MKAAIFYIGTIHPSHADGFYISEWGMDCLNQIPPFEVKEDGTFMLGGYQISELFLIATLKDICKN